MYYLHCIKKISKAKILQMSFHFMFFRLCPRYKYDSSQPTKVRLHLTSDRMPYGFVIVIVAYR